MKKFLEPFLLLIPGAILAAIPLFTHEIYVLELYGINTNLRIEYAGWICIILGAGWLISLFFTKEKINTSDVQATAPSPEKKEETAPTQTP